MAMADLEELVLRCRAESAKAYLQEAVAAYQTGAYRACIVTTWLAVNFDLTAKMRSLAITGVPKATTWVEKLDQLLKQYDPEQPHTAGPLLKIEQQILNDAAHIEIGLISSMELADLKRLRADRNRCAHPTMLNGEEVFAPTAELARTHLRNAVDLVLSRRAITGERLVERILQVTGSPGFTATTKELADYLVTEHLLDGLSRITAERLLRTLITEMLADGKDKAERSRSLRVLEAVRIVQPATCDDLLPKLLNDAMAPVFARSLLRAVSLVVHAPWAWQVLNQIERNRLTNAVTTCDVDGGLRLLKLAARSDALRENVISRLPDLPDEVLETLSEYLPRRVMLDEQCRRLQSSHGFAESRRLLREVFRPSIDELEARHVSAILTAFETNDQVSNATGFPEFLVLILRNCPEEAVGDRAQWERVRPQPGPYDPEDEIHPLAHAIDARFGAQQVPAD